MVLPQVKPRRASCRLSPGEPTVEMCAGKTNCLILLKLRCGERAWFSRHVAFAAPFQFLDWVTVPSVASCTEKSLESPTGWHSLTHPKYQRDVIGSWYARYYEHSLLFLCFCSLPEQPPTLGPVDETR